MKTDDAMSRLRAARPMGAEPGDHEALFARIVAEPGDPRLAQAPGEPSAGLLGRTARLGARARRRVVAGGTLGLAGIGAAVLLALGGTAATTPAFAVTRSSDGSVLVHLNYVKDLNLPQLEAKLHSMGLHEGVTISMATGAARVSGPVTCRQGPGATTTVKVLVGANGTEVVQAGQSAGNTAEGSFHLDSCVTRGDNAAGNTGTGSPGNG
jgi:hypothetical protein